MAMYDLVVGREGEEKSVAGNWELEDLEGGKQTHDASRDQIFKNKLKNTHINQV